MEFSKYPVQYDRYVVPYLVCGSRNGDAVARKVCEALHDALRVEVRGQIQPQDIQPGGKGKVSPTILTLYDPQKGLSHITVKDLMDWHTTNSQSRVTGVTSLDSSFGGKPERELRSAEG